MFVSTSGADYQVFLLSAIFLIKTNLQLPAMDSLSSLRPVFAQCEGHLFIKEGNQNQKY